MRENKLRVCFVVLMMFLLFLNLPIQAEPNPQKLLKQKASGHHQVTKDRIDESDIIVGIDGMVCSFCAQGLKLAFEREGAVKSVNISLEKEQMGLRLKRFRRLSDSNIRQIVEDSGYSLRDIQRTKQKKPSE